MTSSTGCNEASYGKTSTAGKDSIQMSVSSGSCSNRTLCESRWLTRSEATRFKSGEDERMHIVSRCARYVRFEEASISQRCLTKAICVHHLTRFVRNRKLGVC